MRRIKLNSQEIKIENALVQDEYVPIAPSAFEDIARAIAARRKDTVLNIRVNSQDLKCLKLKAKKLGVKYQTFVSELLHRVAHN